MKSQIAKLSIARFGIGMFLISIFLAIPVNDSFADKVYFRSGRMLEGSILGQNRRMIRLRLADGKIVNISKRRLRRIRYEKIVRKRAIPTTRQKEELRRREEKSRSEDEKRRNKARETREEERRKEIKLRQAEVKRTEERRRRFEAARIEEQLKLKKEAKEREEKRKRELARKLKEANRRKAAALQRKSAGNALIARRKKEEKILKQKEAGALERKSQEQKIREKLKQQRELEKQEEGKQQEARKQREKLRREQIANRLRRERERRQIRAARLRKEEREKERKRILMTEPEPNRSRFSLRIEGGAARYFPYMKKTVMQYYEFYNTEVINQNGDTKVIPNFQTIGTSRTAAVSLHYEYARIYGMASYRGIRANTEYEEIGIGTVTPFVGSPTAYYAQYGKYNGNKLKRVEKTFTLGYYIYSGKYLKLGVTAGHRYLGIFSPYEYFGILNLNFFIIGPPFSSYSMNINTIDIERYDRLSARGGVGGLNILIRPGSSYYIRIALLGQELKGDYSSVSTPLDIANDGTYLLRYRLRANARIRVSGGEASIAIYKPIFDALHMYLKISGEKYSIRATSAEWIVDGSDPILRQQSQDITFNKQLQLQRMFSGNDSSSKVTIGLETRVDF